MKDDLFNDWGVCLIDPTHKSSTRGIAPTIPSDRDPSYQMLKNKVQSLTNQMYTLHRVESCGSTANSLAILELTKGCPNACVFAVGSYIAGDGGYLNALSLSSRQLENHGLVLPTRCENGTPEQIKSSVTLPYYIPSGGELSNFRTFDGCSQIKEEGIGCLNYYEDSCLLSLHVILSARRIQDNPVRVLLFEPILAGCGGILSMRCYKILVRLAEIHGFVFLMDEILSFGRMGYPQGLYSMEHLPKEMHRYISMITIGKWLGQGAILKRVRSVDKGEAETINFFPRVVSTKINVTNMLQTWNAVFSKVSLISDWRAHVLEYLGVTKQDEPASYSEHNWGDGLLIFVAGKLSNKRGITSGLHSRFLPKINSDIGNIKKILGPPNKSAFVPVKGWDRASINRDLVSTIRGYCYPQASVELPIPYQISLQLCYEYQKMGIHRRDPPGRPHNAKKQSAYDFCFEDLLGAIKASRIGTEGLKDAQLRSKTTAVCNQAKILMCSAGPGARFLVPDILAHAKIGFHRRAVWRAGRNMVYWQQLLDDDSSVEDFSSFPVKGKLICSCSACSIIMRNVKKKSVGEKGAKRQKKSEVSVELSGAAKTVQQLPVYSEEDSRLHLNSRKSAALAGIKSAASESSSNKKAKKKPASRTSTALKVSEPAASGSLKGSKRKRKQKVTEEANVARASVGKEATYSSSDDGYETQNPNERNGVDSDRDDETPSDDTGDRKPASKTP